MVFPNRNTNPVPQQPVPQQAPQYPPAPQAAPTPTAFPQAPQYAPPAVPVQGFPHSQVPAAFVPQAPAPQSGPRPGLFAGIGSARTLHDKNYMRPGRYLVRIDDSSSFGTQRNGDAFKVGMTVLFVLDDPKGNGHRAGEPVSWMVTNGRYPDAFLPAVKTAVSTIANFDPASLTEQQWQDAIAQVIGPQQSLAGYCAEILCREKPKKEQIPGQPLQMTTTVSWTRFVPGEEVEAILNQNPAQCKLLYPNGVDAVRLSDLNQGG